MLAEQTATREAVAQYVTDDFFRSNLLDLEPGSRMRMKGSFFNRDVTFGQMLDRVRDELTNKENARSPDNRTEAEKVNDRDKSRAAKSWLARSYFAIGRIGDATAMLEAVFVDLKDLCGDESNPATEAGYLLAELYSQQSRLWEALPLYETAYKRKLQVLGANDVGTLSALHNLSFANNFPSLGKLGRKEIQQVRFSIFQRDRVNR